MKNKLILTMFFGSVLVSSAPLVARDTKESDTSGSNRAQDGEHGGNGGDSDRGRGGDGGNGGDAE